MTYYLINVIVPIVLSLLAWYVGKRSSKVGVIVAVIFVFLLFFRLFLLRNPQIEYYLFPWLDYLHFHTWQYPIVGVLIFSVINQLSKRRAQIVALIIFSLYLHNIHDLTWMLKKEEFPLGVRKDSIDGFYIQTSSYTCSPASCANLLRLHKIFTNEKEMTYLCLTRKYIGTYDLGAMRGLNIICSRNGKMYKPVICAPDYKQLQKLNRPGLAAIKLRNGIDHMICVFKVFDEKIEIIDPLCGKITITRQNFERQYHGVFIYLEKNV